MSPSLRFATLLALAALPLTSCNSIRNAPKGAPRLEVEVVYEIDDAFYSPFDASADREQIAQAVREAIEPYADVGLRFYATPSETYGDDANRPTFLMTVRALGIEPERSLDVKEGRPELGEAPMIQARLRRVTCAVSAKLEKRRESGPRLTVGDVKGVGQAKPASEDVSSAIPLKKHSNESNQTHLTDRMLRQSVSTAAIQAFALLQKPVDRELMLMTPKKATGQ